MIEDSFKSMGTVQDDLEITVDDEGYIYMTVNVYNANKKDGKPP